MGRMGGPCGTVAFSGRAGPGRSRRLCPTALGPVRRCVRLRVSRKALVRIRGAKSRGLGPDKPCGALRERHVFVCAVLLRRPASLLQARGGTEQVLTTRADPGGGANRCAWMSACPPKPFRAPNPKPRVPADRLVFL